MRKALLLLVVFMFTAIFASDAWSANGRNSASLTNESTLISNIDKGAGGGGVPVGTIIAWPVSKNPTDMENWLECNGQAVSASVYPELFAMIGAKTPDFRGYFLRGNGGNSAGLGIAQGDAIRNVTGTFDTRVMGVWRDGTGPFRVTAGRANKVALDGDSVPFQTSFDLSRSVPTANENRPINKSVRYLIRSRS